ncbi:MAG: DUF4190 domain-containing protein [Mycobacterium sp.]|nr:DUF4190 domain-containing protein [Mycobacterium sp.]
MTEPTESPERATPTPGTPPPAGPPPYPYAYPPGPPGAPGTPGTSAQGLPPGPYPGGYPPPPMPYGDYYPGAPAAAPRNGLGVAALVVAIIALLASCSVAGGLILGGTAVILGFLARGRVKRGEANNGGLALTGIVLGGLAILISLAFIAMYVGIFNNYGGRELITCIQDAGGDNTGVQACMDAFQQRVEAGQGR